MDRVDSSNSMFYKNCGKLILKSIYTVFFGVQYPWMGGGSLTYLIYSNNFIWL